MCFCSETEKVHFRLASEHDALISKARENVESSRVVPMEHYKSRKHRNIQINGFPSRKN